MLEKDLDVVSMVKRSRNSAILNNVLFSRGEKFLLKFQKKDTIDSAEGNTTSSPGSSDSHFDSVDSDENVSGITMLKR